MDPFSQAAVGGAASQSLSVNKNLGKALVIGLLAGASADLDILIRSSDDPLLAVELHRHFSHSLFFIPFGALICATAIYWLLAKHWQLSFRTTYFWSFAAYATHGLLDGLTTYGTRLYWPFADTRVAWNTISVVDPFFTIPLLICIGVAALQKSKRFLIYGIIWAALYLIAGVIQHERATTLGKELASSRGHTTDQLSAKPSFANLAVWKIIYEQEGRFYVDAVKPGLPNKLQWQGSSIVKLDIERDFPWLEKNTQQYKDVQRFIHFSSGYVAIDPSDSNKIVDIRYSLLPNQIAPMWGIKLNPNASPTDHVGYYTNTRNAWPAIEKLIQMIFQQST